jgi:hypothetical protein
MIHSIDAWTSAIESCRLGSARQPCVASTRNSITDRWVRGPATKLAGVTDIGVLSLSLRPRT